MIGAKYLLTLFFGVAVGLRVVTAHPPTVGAEVALLPVLREAVADEAVAAAVVALEFDHTSESTVSLAVEPLPHRDEHGPHHEEAIQQDELPQQQDAENYQRRCVERVHYDSPFRTPCARGLSLAPSRKFKRTLMRNLSGGFSGSS